MYLSHSAKEMYLTCPKKWQLHYQDKLRSELVGSALFFGSAFDEAQNRMLLEKKKTLDMSETLLMNQTSEETFISCFSKVWIIDQYVDIAKSEKAMYYKSDLDTELLEPKDYKEIFEFAKELKIDVSCPDSTQAFTEECQAIFKKGTVDTETQRLYNFITWLSVKNKGLLMLQAYEEQVMPLIEEVFDVQKKISLKDDDSELRGVIDVICSFHTEPGIKYVCDNKTSSRAYKEDSVSISEQLSTYAEHEQINRCAYLVTEKKLRKRSPRVRCTVIKDTISDEFINKTFDTITEVFHNIKDEKFDKDFDACFQYGRKCPYFDYCRTGEVKNLRYVPKEKKNGN
jgi:hypothetical protein